MSQEPRVAQETAVLTADEGEAHIRFAPFDQVDTFVSQIFWLAVTFGVLYFAVSRYLLPRIRSAIDSREAKISSDIETAAMLSKSADEAVSAYETDIAKARAGARDTAGKAKAEADAKAAAETARVEAALANRLKSAEARIADTRTKAMANVAAIAEDAAGEIVTRLTGQKADAAALKRAVSAVISQS
jgi:F-type H+-transporting ATPase subunit b